MPPIPSDPAMQRCIRDCLDCYSVCKQTAMNHCLEEGGRHVEPEHFRLMIGCAEMCRTAADFMLGSAKLHTRTCAICAEVCDACAQSCEAIGTMDECVRACRKCQESCLTLAVSAAAGKLLQPHRSDLRI
jgi:hypothetical protein